jgi:CBS domain-containing protein
MRGATAAHTLAVHLIPSGAAMTTPTPTFPRLDLVRVEDVMHPGLIVCDPAAPLSVIAEAFAEERIHCVVVNGIERPRDGERLTWGIVSDRDLIRALDAPGEGVTAGSLAVTAVVTVEPQEPLDRAVQPLAEYDVAHVLVVERDYPVGIVSTLDVARAVAGI